MTGGVDGVCALGGGLAEWRIWEERRRGGRPKRKEQDLYDRQIELTSWQAVEEAQEEEDGWCLRRSEYGHGGL